MFLGKTLIALPSWYAGPNIILLFPGAFILFGFIIAGSHAINRRARAKAGKPELAPEQRCRMLRGVHGMHEVSWWTEIALLLVGAALVQNILLTRFIALCSFFGISNSMKTSVGMSLAVIFVMVMASSATWVFYYGLLEAARRR